MPKRQCTAKAKSTGKRCTNAPILGGTVCRLHGGAAGQVKRAAKRRLLDLVDPALGELARILDEDRRTIRGRRITPDHILRAIKQVIDKAEPDELLVRGSGVVTTASVDPSQLRNVPTEDLQVAQRVLGLLMGLPNQPLLTDVRAEDEDEPASS